MFHVDLTKVYYKDATKDFNHVKTTEFYKDTKIDIDIPKEGVKVFTEIKEETFQGHLENTIDTFWQ